MAVAGVAMFRVLAHGLTGHASALEGLSAAQNEASIVGDKGRAQLRCSCLWSGAGRAVSSRRANVAASAGTGEDSTVAAGTTHDVHAGLAVISGLASGDTLIRPLSGTSTDGLSL